MDSKTLWSDVSDRLRSILSTHEFNTWFGQCVMQVSGDTAILLVPNYLFLNWIKDRYRSMLEQALLLAAGQPMLLALAINNEIERNPPQMAPLSQQPAGAATDNETPKNHLQIMTHAPLVIPQPSALPHTEHPISSNISPKYDFSNFLIGPGNELAHAACMAIVTLPVRQYNPLFIHGGPGLGKTHLLFAVGNAILQKTPQAKVYYCLAENFANELTEAVKSDKVAIFQNKYRTLDCLLLDDIQFLGSQERVHEEFFHTFNALYNAGKQIVATSDKMPKETPYLGKKMSSRFEWGLLADLQPPDHSLKIAILHNKAAERGVELDMDVARFLASQSDNNIRSLEGYLTKLIAISEIQGVAITMEMVTKVISSMLTDRKVKIEDIISITAAYFGISIEDIKSGRKSREISYPRQVSMYLARLLTKNSFPELGLAFGNKNHSTVVKGFQKIEYLVKSNYEISEQVRRLEQAILDGKPVRMP